MCSPSQPLRAALLSAFLAIAAWTGNAQAAPRLAMHAGSSDSPATGATGFLMLGIASEVQGLPLGLDYIALNVGNLRGRSESGQRLHGHIVFVSGQFGYRLGRWSLASGLAAVSETTEALSSGFQFHSQLLYRIGHWELGLGHLSNAGLRRPNRGETFLSLGRAF
jgi:hypothetical protein